MSRTLSQLILAIALTLSYSSASATDARRAASGATQVVASVDDREITISELRLEMARLGLTPDSQEAERTALASLVRRTLLTNEAREKKLHRTPEAMMRMHAAQDQALADYLLAAASQPAEPTPGEIEEFVSANPTLFNERRKYDFLIIELPTHFFDDSKLTPLFDEETDFSRLKAVLDGAGATYTEVLATQSSSAFPQSIRDVLSKYTVSDNIVLKGEKTTKVMKILSVRKEIVLEADWPRIARRMLLEKAAVERAENYISDLNGRAQISYFRESVAPVDRVAKREP